MLLGILDRVGLWAVTDRMMFPDNPDSILFYGEYLLGEFDVEIDFYAESAEEHHPIVLEVASGDQPDIYLDYLGRVSEFANGRYAHDILPLVGQEVMDQYLPSFLGLMNKGGVQYGLPITAWISTMIVNVTLLERVGMLDVIADGAWTIEEFTEASRRVTALGPDYYGYSLFSKNTGGDYWYLGFLPGFGANLYANNEIALNSDEGRAALEWYLSFQDEGLSPPGPATRDDRAFMASWHTGKYLATARAPNLAIDAVGEAAFSAGNAEEAFKAAVTAFPTAEGVEHAPLAMGPNGAMIFNKGGVSQEIVDVFLALTGYRAQLWRSKMDSRYASLYALQGARPNDPVYTMGSEILEREGVWDMGIGLKIYNPIRVLVPPLFQAIYTRELTVQEAIERFERDGNRILGE